MTQRTEEKLEGGRVRIHVTPEQAMQEPGGAVELSAEDYGRYQKWRASRGEPIQNFLPDLDDVRRELLLTGLSPETWTDVFGGGPE